MAYPVELRNNLNDELPDGTPVKRYYAFQELCLEVLYETYAQLRVDYARLTGELAITDSLPPGSREDDDPQVVRDVMRMGFVPAYPEEAAETGDLCAESAVERVVRSLMFDTKSPTREALLEWIAEHRPDRPQQ